MGGVKIVNKEHGGESSTRNRGIAEAKGKYIWFVDSDDEIEPESITLILQQIDNEAPECLLFDYNFLSTDEKPKKQDYGNTPPRVRHLGQKEIFSEIVQSLFGYSKTEVYKFFHEQPFTQYTFLNGGSMWNMVIKRSVIENNKLLFNNRLVINQDGMFILNMFCFVKSATALYAKIYNYYYRPTGSLQRFQKQPEALVKVKIALAKERLRICEQYKQRYVRDFTECYDGSLFFSAMELCIKLSREKYRKHLRMFLEYVSLASVKAALGRIDTSQAPLKYKLPVLLLCNGYYRTLFSLIYIAHRIGFDKYFKQMFYNRRRSKFA